VIYFDHVFRLKFCTYFSSLPSVPHLRSCHSFRFHHPNNNMRINYEVPRYEFSPAICHTPRRPKYLHSYVHKRYMANCLYNMASIDFFTKTLTNVEFRIFLLFAIQLINITSWWKTQCYSFSLCSLLILKNVLFFSFVEKYHIQVCFEIFLKSAY
jgi:hypothetical protein